MAIYFPFNLFHKTKEVLMLVKTFVAFPDGEERDLQFSQDQTNPVFSKSCTSIKNLYIKTCNTYTDKSRPNLC